MSPLDLIRSRDGSMSLTKLAASTFHLLIALAVAGVTAVRLYRYCVNGEIDPVLFDITMWTVYGGFSVGHAITDKTTAKIAAFKDRKLDAAAPAGTVTTSTTTTTKEAP